MYIEVRMNKLNKPEISHFDASYPGYVVYEDEEGEDFFAMTDFSFSRNKAEPRTITLKAKGWVEPKVFTFEKDEQIDTFSKLIKSALGIEQLSNN